MLPWILFLIAASVAVAMGWVAYRFYKKAVILDSIFQFVYEDIETNVRQFYKMSKSNVLMADPEIQTAHRNMMIMRGRLEEIVGRMESATGLRLRPPPSPPRPKVI
jgi:hypothetical protein